MVFLFADGSEVVCWWFAGGLLVVRRWVFAGGSVAADSWGGCAAALFDHDHLEKKFWQKGYITMRFPAGPPRQY